MKAWHGVAILVAIACVYGIGRRESRLSREAANWKKNAQDALAAGNFYRVTSDSLRGVETRLRGRQALLQRDLSRLQATADDLAHIADTSIQVGPIRIALPASQAAGSVCLSTLAVADSGWTACGIRASLAEARAARLDSLLRIGVKVNSCHVLGFLPCPSRGLAFLGGAIGGYLLTR